MNATLIKMVEYPPRHQQTGDINARGMQELDSFILQIKQHEMKSELLYQIQHAVLHNAGITRHAHHEQKLYHLPTGGYCANFPGKSAEAVKQMAYRAVKSIWPLEPEITCEEVTEASFSGLKEATLQEKQEWDIKMAFLKKAVETQQQYVSEFRAQIVGSKGSFVRPRPAPASLSPRYDVRADVPSQSASFAAQSLVKS